MHRYLAAVLFIVGACVVPTDARAETCPGNLIGVKPLLWGDGARLGELQLYYNPGNGRNCARVVHGGETWGKRRTTSVQIETCTQAVFRANGRTCPGAASIPRRQWSGVTQYSTNAVSLPGQGRCVDATGSIERRLNAGGVTASRLAGFCGG
ncbi:MULTISPECIES: hypothetical protein [Luteimonas]|uniref:hypothetical protein n=1 Tax=Luteimonas TaxID=83614 RepID=UPI00117CAC34|nr:MULTISPECIES: hypothetical protein [Luteimonas]